MTTHTVGTRPDALDMKGPGTYATDMPHDDTIGGETVGSEKTGSPHSNPGTAARSGAVLNQVYPTFDMSDGQTFFYSHNIELCLK